jgi:mitotic spindle assembly checkpoint protein MAD1
MKNNPASTVYSKQMAELAALREENKRLLEYYQRHPIPESTGETPLSISNTSSMGTLARLNREKESMEKKIAELELRTQRLKEVCGKKVMEFREACTMLTGWKIEMLEDATLLHGNPIQKYRISSIYADEDAAYLLFQIIGNTVELLPTEFSSSIPPKIYKWISQYHSIPSFLAELTTNFADLYFSSRRAIAKD